MKKSQVYITSFLLLLTINNANATEKGSTYIEVFGGFADSVSGSPDSGTNTAGGLFNGRISNIDSNVNHTLGARLGYQLSKNWRFDLSYYDFSGDLDWTTSFPGFSDSTFEADLDAQVLLLNAYYSFDTGNKLSPYLGVGIGASRNRLSSINEFFGTTLGAFPESNTETEFAYRISAGMEYPISKSWQVNLDLSLINIGDISSGDSRAFVAGGAAAIGEYEFDDSFISTFNFGLKYSF